MRVDQKVMRHTRQIIRVLLLVTLSGGVEPASGASYRQRATWPDTLAGTREALRGETLEGPEIRSVYVSLMRDFPVETDWLSRDSARYEMNRHFVPHRLATYLEGGRDSSFEESLVAEAIAASGDAGRRFVDDMDTLVAESAPAGDRRWLELFADVCRERRARRLGHLIEADAVIAFIQRHPVRPSFYAYTEGQSDAQHERHFHPGSRLCRLRLDEAGGSIETLVEDPSGVLRDLDVSYDGQRLLFAWKKSDRQDDYHLYEMLVATREIRQLTSGLGVADYEGCYLPNEDIIFSSTRCVETVDCWWTEVSNMYTCDRDGRFLRRLGFDQVHTVHPSVLNSGAVVYTRWDYNDRGQVFPQALFQMNPDGTGQTEYYGNNSWYPTVIDHARAIPGSDKLVAILHGHHTWQAGELALIDRSKGTQEADGVQPIAPVRDATAVRVDRLGQTRELFRHPWPINEREFIVSMTPDRNARENPDSPFGLYWIDVDGNRELLAYDESLSSGDPVLVQPRARPPVKPAGVDYTRDHGVYFVQDVYEGPGLAGISRGTVKALRVVALDFRAAGIGNNGSGGEAGSALVSTPIAVGNGSWDVKRILGQATVHEDGSAMFKAPSHTPVYFQALDDQGQMVQTMRSWSTLMPGETFGCVGCHENKLATPPLQTFTQAARAGPQALTPFYGPARGFSFSREIQPILDRHCITCHTVGPNDLPADEPTMAFSLKADPSADRTAGRDWSRSYLILTGAVKSDTEAPQRASGDPERTVVNWVSSQSRPSMLPPYHRGSATSGMIHMLREGHHDVTLSREEMDKLCAWIDLGVPFCGDYLEANNWSPGQRERYLSYQRKRERLAAEVRRNTEALIQQRTGRVVTLADPGPRYPAD